MNPSEKPKQGCGPGIVFLLIVGGLYLFVNHRWQEVTKMRADEERQEQAAKIEREHAERIKAEEHARIFETPITADGVPGRIEALMKEKLGERFVSSSATYGEKEKGWNIIVEGKVVLSDRMMIQQEMIELLAASVPKGMTVSSFSMTYRSDFTDGLGHKSVQTLVRCSTVPTVIEKIEWGDRELDLYSLNFNKIFRTEKCHPSFAAEWTGPKK